jgi:Flp pilus assembly pilin Flp
LFRVSYHEARAIRNRRSPALEQDPALISLFQTMRHLPDLVYSEDAATAVEYAVMLALVLMAIIGAIGSLGAETGGMWGGIKSDLEGVGFIESP